MTTRGSWNDYFMGIAREVSTRATCDRKHVGAVIVRDKSILATGYNGSVRGLPHCDDVGHLMEDGHCVPGDTVVSKMQTGDYNNGHRDIRTIFDQWHHSQKRGAMVRMNIRAVNAAGVIVPDRIADIWSLGRKPLVRVTTRLGREVRVTEDHRLKVPSGWAPAGQLRVGGLVGLNGQPLYDDSTWLRARYETDGLDQIAIAKLAGCNRKTVRERLDSFGITRRPFQLGGWNRGMQRNGTPGYKGPDASSSSARSRARRYALTDHCTVCSDTNELQVHHLDGNEHNDADDNLVTLCVACHNLAHTPHARRESVVYDKVVLIESAGIEEVFDLQTKRHHNFVGNGFVLHNCVRTIHAEANALAQAARNGVRIDGASIYVTANPCWGCFRLIVNAGIEEIYFGDTYRMDSRIFDAAKELGIKLIDTTITGAGVP
jgi:deoxycytidylate deaminase